jgi:hypothetical protein
MRNYFVYTTVAMVSFILLIICQSQYGFLIAFSYVLIVIVAKRLSFGKLFYLSIIIIGVTFGVMHYYESRGLYYIHLGNVGRIEKYVDALVAFTQYPITGIGFGGLIRRHELGIGQLHLTLLEDGFKLISGTPENAFLGILGETGLLGAIPFYLLIGYYLKVVFGSRPKAAVVGFGDYGSVALILKLLLVSLLWSLIAGDNQFSFITWSLFNLFSLYNKIKKK